MHATAEITLALTATEAALWTGLTTAVIAAVASAVVAVIGALKGQAAKTSSEEVGRRVDSQGQSIKSLRSDLTAVALQTPPPSAPADPDAGPDVNRRGGPPPPPAGLVNPFGPTGGQ